MNKPFPVKVESVMLSSECPEHGPMNSNICSECEGRDPYDTCNVVIRKTTTFSDGTSESVDIEKKRTS